MKKTKAKRAAARAVRQQRPDLVLLLSALIYGRARWEPFAAGVGEVCVGGMRYLTHMDSDGCPVVNGPMRDALTAAALLSGQAPAAPLSRGREGKGR